MAIVINFYDPIFKIMMYYAILYDKRFNFDSLVRFSLRPSVSKNGLKLLFRALSSLF
jgi:hypothetical protein